MRILEAVEAVNDDQKSVLFNKINAYFGGDLQGKTVAFWGLSFKPNTDDMREARPPYWRTFCSKRARTFAPYDPVAMEEAKHQLTDSITYCNSY